MPSGPLRPGSAGSQAGPPGPPGPQAGFDPEDLLLALELCDLADSITTAAFRRAGLVVETKPDLTPVTEADRQVEQVLAAELARRRPGDSVLGEEFGAGPPSISAPAPSPTMHPALPGTQPSPPRIDPLSPGTQGSLPGGARRWIIDTIDGTKNFVRGIPVWATLIALEVGGTTTVGAVSAPALSRRWWAARGRGAYAGPPGAPGTPIRVSAVACLEDAQLSGASLSGWQARGGPAGVVELALRCWRDRGFGDFWSHVLVAEGACEIALDPEVSLWDLAALQVIVEEAGGCFTDLSGQHRADGGSAISTNGLLHEAALAVLNGAQHRGRA